ncbi:MAG: hypothetical protein A2622_04665 [Bdellovibrionales bacterium RIFCSPHIGHO2_01_FULL_40_29]|nr:MAG: hypothetical protein A2622_04665 [Bdellovibrionales bacterium RIFCSPHIGHO2_01_FULL_40_29]OFZ34774.1 MAG: hypothetical protein A3D17_10710 [Bdellovibrionales bacterium RIFCSPHIGHO2_02_FULL_40_15]
MLALVVIYLAFITYILLSPPNSVTYNRYRVESTTECSLGTAKKDELTLSAKNISKIERTGRIRVILHKSEGCIKKGMHYKINSSEVQKIAISEIFLVPYKYLNQGKKDYLLKILNIQEQNELIERQFYLLDLEIVPQGFVDEK